MLNRGIRAVASAAVEWHEVSSEHGEPERPATKADVQAELGMRAAREAGIDIGVARFADGGLDFLHQQGAILVRDA